MSDLVTRSERGYDGWVRQRPALDTQLRTVMVSAVEEAGISRAEIARRTGLDRSTVSYVLNGRRSGSIDTWDLILAGAGVELGYRITVKR